jgi:hypothetical protein
VNKFDEFQKTYDQAIKTIRTFQTPGEHEEPPMDGLVNWMLETDANPASFLPRGWSFSLRTAEGFAEILQTIHHALYDDGDITFVAVDGEPRITFVDRYDDKFRENILYPSEINFEKLGKVREYDIQILDIEPNEFGSLYDMYQKKYIKSCFFRDASYQDVNWVAGLYREYKCWDENWINECKTLLSEKKRV